MLERLPELGNEDRRALAPALVRLGANDAHLDKTIARSVSTLLTPADSAELRKQEEHIRALDRALKR
jgi:hypothetical protein